MVSIGTATFGGSKRGFWQVVSQFQARQHLHHMLPQNWPRKVTFHFTADTLHHLLGPSDLRLLAATSKRVPLPDSTPRIVLSPEPPAPLLPRCSLPPLHELVLPDVKNAQPLCSEQIQTFHGVAVDVWRGLAAHANVGAMPGNSCELIRATNTGKSATLDNV